MGHPGLFQTTSEKIMVRSINCMFAVAWALALVSTSGAADPTIGIGSPAPKLEVKEFIKGDAVKAFEKNKIYVVEFWATWCGPCKASIPHLTELQKKNKEAVFIGVSVWEEDPSAVAPFVKKMGDKMDYRVALDLVPPMGEGEGEDGKMARGWLKAAKLTGIPTAFVVNGDGVIAWIGHPSDLARPLSKIIAGQWDVAAAAKREKLKSEIEAKLEKVEDEKPADVVKYLDDKFKLDPELEDAFGIDKFVFMLRMVDARAKAADYGRRLIEKLFADDKDALSAITQKILDSGSEELGDTKMLALAVQAAERADTLAGEKDDQIAELLASAHFAKGDALKAVAAQKRAIKLAKGAEEPDEEQIRELEKKLKEYQKAAGKK
jgi:thiol-disulfide isomerase/thioredoxin